MGLFILYEVVGEPWSAYPNAFEIPHLHSGNEVFFSDVLSHFAHNLPTVGYKYIFYVLVHSSLVWVESPATLLPVGADQVVRLLLKPVSIPLFQILPSQSSSFGGKSRIELYSKEDYENTRVFSHSSFNRAAENVAICAHRNQISKRPPLKFQGDSRNYVETENEPDVVDPYCDQNPRQKWDAFSDSDHQTFSGDKLQKDGKVYNNDSGAGVFGRTAKSTASAKRTQSNGIQYTGHEKHSSPYEPRHNNGGNKSTNPEVGLNAYVGSETAAVLTEAAEAAGVAAQSIYSFASNLFASASSITSGHDSFSGRPGKFNPGARLKVILLMQ
jgi:hypothetical protein